ncbi:MAG: methyl-accepting chemotaxis protein [Paenibacillaceae bacterium]|nr:methyl-accepting chemotaxis protein [Paenibacillaceae bacterium]
MKLTIGRKLMGSFLTIAVLLVITNGLSFYYLKKIDSAHADLIERRAVILSNAKAIQLEAANQSGAIRGFILTKNPVMKTQLQRAYDKLNELVGLTLPLVEEDEDVRKLNSLSELNKQFKAKYDELLQMVQNNADPAQIIDFYTNTVLPFGSQLDPIADEIASGQQELMDQGAHSNTALVETAVTLVSVISAIAVILALSIGYLLSRLISRPIAAMEKTARSIAAGDLSVDQIRVTNKDEIGALAASFNGMSSNLRELIRQASQSAEQVAAASEELTASAEQTSRASETIAETIQGVVVSSEKQATSVGESVRAMGEMSAGVQQIAAGAQTAASASLQAAQKTIDGHQAIRSAVSQMQSIQASYAHLSDEVREMGDRSGEIGDIIDVITDIASRTNLLALNAAIEAARAGEQGRGFAVVAGEVRKLAEQSAQSANQITALIVTIRASIGKSIGLMDRGSAEIGEGMRIVSSAGTAFGEIRTFVEHAASQVQEVSAASEQMSASSAQVAHAFDLIAEGSRTVAAGSQNVSAATEEQLAAMEEISSSAMQLERMSGELQGLIGKFRM